MAQIRAALFDMDGLLINTEDMYTEATNEILAEHGKGPLPWEVKIQLQGRPGHEAASYFLNWSELPYSPKELFDKTSKIQETKWPKTEFLDGALELLQYLRAQDIPIALASSSTKANYLKKTKHLRHGFDLFGSHVVVGDDPRVPKGRGKPAPDIWLVALESLNAERRATGLDEIKPEETLVFEDSVPGVTSGRAAGCNVVWVPHEKALGVLDEEAIEKVIGHHDMLSSLEDLDKQKYGL